ncbi:hypothetical protein L9F63_014834, partial [Diploptera punctata]
FSLYFFCSVTIFTVISYSSTEVILRLPPPSLFYRLLTYDVQINRVPYCYENIISRKNIVPLYKT